MSINFTLVPNHLNGSDEARFIARVQSTGSLNMPQIIELMLKKGSTVTKADIVSVLENYAEIIETFLGLGYIVNTNIARFRPSIKGTFASNSDPFDPASHALSINASPSPRILEKVRGEAQINRQPEREMKYDLVDFIDFQSGTINQTITSGSVAQLRGQRLEVDPDDPASGIFFIDSAGAESEVALIVNNSSRNPLFRIPDLPPGAYTLEVRVPTPKGLRAIKLNETLTVA